MDYADVDDAVVSHVLIPFGHVERVVYELTEDLDALNIPFPERLKIVKTLYTICKNIHRCPEELRYHRLDCSNSTLVSRIFTYPRALEFCKTIGFACDPVSSGDLVYNLGLHCEEVLARTCELLSKTYDRVKTRSVTLQRQVLAETDDEPLPDVPLNIRVFSESVSNNQLPPIENSTDDLTSDLSLLMEASKVSNEKAKYASLLVSQEYVKSKLPPKKRFQKASVRFKFSDGIIAQADFLPTASVSDLFDCLSLLMLPNLPPFQLIIPPNLVFTSESDGTLVDMNLLPLVMFYVVPHDHTVIFRGNHVLKTTYLDALIHPVLEPSIVTPKSIPDVSEHSQSKEKKNRSVPAWLKLRK